MEYGKFNSAEELLKGYTELEKSFTQKCQRVSALEKELNGGINVENTSPQVTQSAEQPAVEEKATVPVLTEADSPQDAPSDSAETSAIERIKQYLASHPEEACLLRQPTEKRAAPPKVMTAGGNVSMALPSRPKTIKEASAMAKELFRNA